MLGCAATFLWPGVRFSVFDFKGTVQFRIKSCVVRL